MSDFARTHAALFDELERQGIYCADVVKLTRAVAQSIAQGYGCASVSVGSPARRETCE